MPVTQSLTRWCGVLGCLAVIVLAGCNTPKVNCDPRLVSNSLQWRTGAAPEKTNPSSQVIPPGVGLSDGLSEDEAVQTALTNNSAFQSTLAQLGMAGGDAVQANLIANPQLLIYFPSGAKEGQYTLFAPIESYFLRPARVKVANREYQRIGQGLVQNGLNLARDVRIAYADYALASEQASLAREALQLRADIAELTKKRLENGDISELETTAASVDMLSAKATASMQQYSVSIAEAKLVSLIGLPLIDAPLMPMPLNAPVPIALDEAQLIEQALACRPDYHAAQWAVAAASERSKLSRWSFLSLDGVLDIRDGLGYTRTGGGLRANIPIFNRNQGGILRADWEVNGAMHSRDAIHDQIVMDVRMAARQLRQAQENLAILTRDVAPAIADALSIAQKGFADGGTDYLLVLQTTTQYLDVRAKMLDQTAATRKALAELERSVGSSLADGLVDIEALIGQTAPPVEATEEQLTDKPAGEAEEPLMSDDRMDLGS